MRRDKVLEKMRQNPRDWRISELEKIARSYEVTIRKTGGSHVVFDHPDSIAVCACVRRPIKPVYIKRFVAFIELIGGQANAQAG